MSQLIFAQIKTDKLIIIQSFSQQYTIFIT